MSDLGARGGRLSLQADAGRTAVARRKKQVRLDGEGARRNVVLRAAVKVVRKDPEGGLMGLSWDDVAKACEVKTSAITARRMFLRLNDLRQAVVQNGAALGDPVIIEQGKRFGFID